MKEISRLVLRPLRPQGSLVGRKVGWRDLGQISEVISADESTFEIEVSALCLNRVAETRVMRRRGAPEILESLAANRNSLSETSAFVSESRKIGPAKTSSLQKFLFESGLVWYHVG
jgi:hypothetical protein